MARMVATCWDKKYLRPYKHVLVIVRSAREAFRVGEARRHPLGETGSKDMIEVLTSFCAFLHEHLEPDPVQPPTVKAAKRVTI